MIKKALIFSNTMNQGGAETFLMKLYRKLDKSKYQFDFYIMGGEGHYDSEILELGGQITYGSMKTQGLKNYRRDLRFFLLNNKYNYVFKSIGHSISAGDLLFVKKYNNPKNIVLRSMNSTSKKKALHYFFRPLSNFLSNKKVAPSTEAATYMFGKSQIKNKNVEIIINGVDLNLFSFDEKKRIDKRKELGISNNDLTFLHIGRFSYEKNHMELADIFLNISKLEVNSRFIFVGTGPLKGPFIEKLKTLSLIDKVIFLEKRDDINELMMASDALLLPSLFEGLPNVVMEAQAVNLPCVISNNVTRECAVTNIVIFKPLGFPNEWAKESIYIASNNINKRNTRNCFPKENDIELILEKYIKLIFD